MNAYHIKTDKPIHWQKRPQTVVSMHETGESDLCYTAWCGVWWDWKIWNTLLDILRWKLFQVQIFGHQTDFVCAAVAFFLFPFLFFRRRFWFDKHRDSEIWSSSLIFELAIEVWLRNFNSTNIRCYPKRMKHFAAAWMIFDGSVQMPTHSDPSIDSHIKWIKLKKKIGKKNL